MDDPYRDKGCIGVADKYGFEVCMGVAGAVGGEIDWAVSKACIEVGVSSRR